MIQSGHSERLCQVDVSFRIQQLCGHAGNDRVRRRTEAARCATLFYSFCIPEDEQRHARHRIHSVLPPLHCEEECHDSNSKHLGTCAQTMGVMLAALHAVETVYHHLESLHARLFRSCSTLYIGLSAHTKHLCNEIGMVRTICKQAHTMNLSILHTTFHLHLSVMLHLVRSSVHESPYKVAAYMTLLQENQAVMLCLGIGKTWAIEQTGILCKELSLAALNEKLIILQIRLHHVGQQPDCITQSNCLQSAH